MKNTSFVLKALFAGSSLLVIIQGAKGQCSPGVAVSSYASQISINCGDTVKLGALGNQSTVMYSNNFNTTCPGAGWNGSVSATCSNPCGSGPSGAGGDTYLWMGSTATAPRNVTTIGYDVSNGGTICFDMRFAAEEACAQPTTCLATSGVCNCEGPDLPDEGVHLQYSKTGGPPWIEIDYWDPNGGCDANLINWNNHCVTIPAGAFGPNTRFRWYQTASSSLDADHWGIDNVVITVPNLSYTYDWAHDSQGPNISSDTPPVVPGSTTTYTVTYTNGTSICTSSITVTVALPTGTVSASPDSVCPGATSQLNVIASLVPAVPATCGISAAGCKGVATNINVGAGVVNDPLYAPLGRGLPAGGISFCSCSTVNGVSSGNCDNSGSTQMIILASELPAFFRGGQFYSMAFTAFSVTAGTSFTNFTISMTCTNKTEFASNTDFIAGLVTVFDPKTVTISNATKTFDFDRRFDWDGTSNIVVQFCWKNTGTGSSSYRSGNLYKTATPNFSTIHAYSCGSKGCTETGGATRYQNRPSLNFGICYIPMPAISYLWSPSGGLSNTAIQNPIATVNSTTTYTVVVADANKPQCNYTTSVTVKTKPAPPLAISSGPCTNDGGSKTLVANGQSFCNTNSTTPTVHNSNSLQVLCIDVTGVIPGTFNPAFLNAFVDIAHPDPNEVSNNAGTNATIEIKGPGTSGWTTLTGFTADGKTWTGLPLGSGTPSPGDDVNGQWCIRFKDNCVACPPDPVSDGGGASFQGWCISFNQGVNSVVSYSWSPGTGLSPNNTSQAVTAAGDAITTYSVTATGVNGCTSQASITVGVCPLPIELLFFTAVSLDKKVKIDWKTATEINTDRFEVERSSDAVNFTRIGSIKAAGNSTSNRNYGLFDEDPLKGTSYYRLKQIDIDGKFEHFQIVSVEMGIIGVAAQKIRPVPATDKIVFDINSQKEGNIIVEVYDLLGKQMSKETKALNLGSNTLSTDVTPLSKGVYFLKITDKEGEIHIQKFLK